MWGNRRGQVEQRQGVWSHYKSGDEVSQDRRLSEQLEYDNSDARDCHNHGEVSYQSSVFHVSNLSSSIGRACDRKRARTDMSSMDYSKARANSDNERGGMWGSRRGAIASLDW